MIWSMGDFSEPSELNTEINSGSYSGRRTNAHPPSVSVQDAEWPFSAQAPLMDPVTDPYLTEPESEISSHGLTDLSFYFADEVGPSHGAVAHPAQYTPEISYYPQPDEYTGFIAPQVSQPSATVQAPSWEHSASQEANNGTLVSLSEQLLRGYPSFDRSISVGPNEPGQNPPPGKRYSLDIGFWDEERALYVTVRAQSHQLQRRLDNNYVNLTKILAFAGISRGDGASIIKREKVKHHVRSGKQILWGTWIPFKRAYQLANTYKVADVLFPLFVADLVGYLYNAENSVKTKKAIREALGSRKPFEQLMVTDPSHAPGPWSETPGLGNTDTSAYTPQEVEYSSVPESYQYEENFSNTIYGTGYHTIPLNAQATTSFGGSIMSLGPDNQGTEYQYDSQVYQYYGQEMLQ